MTWPWKRHPTTPPVDAEDAKRLLKAAQDREPRTQRLTRQTQHAIAQNHFAVSIKKAMES